MSLAQPALDLRSPPPLLNDSNSRQHLSRRPRDCVIGLHSFFTVPPGSRDLSSSPQATLLPWAYPFHEKIRIPLHKIESSPVQVCASDFSPLTAQTPIFNCGRTILSFLRRVRSAFFYLLRADPFCPGSQPSVRRRIYPPPTFAAVTPLMSPPQCHSLLRGFYCF